MNRIYLILMALAFSASAAVGHPLPNLRFDRTLHVRLNDDAVTVKYTLEINDWTMVLDGKDLLTPADTQNLNGSMGYAEKYAVKKAAILAEQLQATYDGKPLEFQVASVHPDRIRDHLEFRFEFRAGWKLTPGSHKFQFDDQSFDGRSGAVTLTLANTGKGFTLADEVEPEDLRGRSTLELTPEEAQRIRVVSATVVVPRNAVAGDATVSSPIPVPDDGPSQPTEPHEHTITVTQDLSERGLAALFDTGYGQGMLLLLALAFGAAHAFTPGHGKTLVAAYLVGERGTVRHALVLGLTTTLAHTGSVIVVALILQQVYGEQVPAITEAILKIVGGLLIFAVGLWLFLQRARGRADHVHLFADHHHGHSHGHHHDHSHDHHHAPARSFGWARVILLGLGGGIVPCWDAVLLLLLSISAGRLGAAIPLLLAFSIGLALVLVMLGIAVVYAHRFGGSRFGESRWFQRLPMVSAILMLGMGLWFARAGVQSLFTTL
ncbi:MAG: hypothetical protein LC104_16030 [Bacteroidales bacterium]|nr:hypothetical protein [Bacteroidales bacterium]